MKEIIQKYCTIFVFTKIMVFLIPLFFLSFTPLQLGMDNYGKYFLLGATVIPLTLLYFFKQIQGNYIKYERGPLDLSFLLFLVALLFASLLGADKFVSFFGNLDNTSLPFIYLFIFFIFYLLLSNLLDDKYKIVSLIKTLLFSSAIIVVAATIVFVLYRINNLSAFFRLATGTIEDLSMYLVIFVVFALSLFSSSNFKKLHLHNKLLSFFNVLIVLAVLLLFRIDFLYAWWILFFGMVLVVIFRLVIARKSIDAEKSVQKWKKLLAPILLIFVSLNFLLNFYLVYGPSSLNSRLATYRQLDNTKTFVLAGNVLADNPFWGVGLENFDYAYSRYRGAELNSDNFWDLRFNKPGSFFFDIVIAGGLFGALSFLFILTLIIWYCSKVFFKYKEEQPRDDSTAVSQLEMAFLLVPALIISIVSLFVYSSSFNSLFFLCVLSSIFIMLLKKESVIVISKKRYLSFESHLYNFKEDKSLRLSVYLSFGLFFVFSIVFLAYTTKFLISDAWANYDKTGEAELIKSKNLSGHRYQYDLNLAKIYFNRSKTEIKNGNIDEAQIYQEKAMEYAHSAQQISPNSILSAESAGAMYRDFSEGDDGYNQLSLRSFLAASELEPSNPVILTELGQRYFVANDFTQAEKFFRKALELKIDYKLAEQRLAKTLAVTNRKDEAMQILKKLSAETNDPSSHYELGLLFFNDNKYEEAQVAFGAALTLSPLHANTLFGMALTFEKTGDKDKALFYLKKLQRLNPLNKEVADKIKALEAKK